MGDEAPEEPQWDTMRKRVEYLETLSKEAIQAMTPSDLLWELDLLFDQVIDKYGKYCEAKNELQATERLARLATKHEDAALAQGLADGAHSHRARRTESKPCVRAGASALSGSGAPWPC